MNESVSVNKRHLHIVDGCIYDKKKGIYDELYGMIVDIQFIHHDLYGENINIKLDTQYGISVLSLPTNTNYSINMMQFLLQGDLKKNVCMKSYDFIGEDNKRAKGISFKQNGKTVQLRIEKSLIKDKDWWEEASKEDIKILFENSIDWYVKEVQEKIYLQFSSTIS